MSGPGARRPLADLIRPTAVPPPSPEPTSATGRARERWWEASRNVQLRQQEAEEARQQEAAARLRALEMGKRRTEAERRVCEAGEEWQQRIGEYFAELDREKEITNQEGKK